MGRGRLESLACCSVRPLLCTDGSPDASDPALPPFSPFGRFPRSCFWKRRRNACAASFKWGAGAMARTSLHWHCFHLCSCPRASMLQRRSRLCVEGGRTCTNGTTETTHGCTPAFPCTTAQNGHSTTLFVPDPRRITCAWNRRLILVPPHR